LHGPFTQRRNYTPTFSLVDKAPLHTSHPNFEEKEREWKHSLLSVTCVPEDGKGTWLKPKLQHKERKAQHNCIYR
jgi:hypothetical protein